MLGFAGPGRGESEQTVDLDLGISLAGLLVGVVVGLTGMGGGALMTPLLVLFFGVHPLAAVSNDLVAAVVMKPIGGGIHFRRGTVHTGLVRWLAVGSVPAAFAGAYAVSHLDGADVESRIETILGVVLLVASAAMMTKAVMQARWKGSAEGEAAERVPVRVLPTVVVGVVGGLVVGMTSVGSGSLMIVALMLLYPTLSAKEMVGTDLVQAVPLVLAAAAGHALFGHVELGLTSSLLIGSVPGVWIGAHLSSRAADHYIRPVLVLVLVVSGLKLLGAGNAVLGSVIGVVAVGSAAAFAARSVSRRRTALEGLEAPTLVR